MALDMLRRQLATSDEDLTTLGVVPVPLPDETAEAAPEPDLLAPFYRPVAEAEMPPEGIRRSLDEEQRLAPLFRRDAIPENLRRSTEAAPRAVARAATVAKTPVPAAVAAKAPETTLIPVASAPGKADVPGAVTGAIPPTTSTQPAPPAGTSSNVKAPPVEAGSGGDDDVRNLYLARLAAQSAAGFGGMGAGKNIDMGIADTLGERMKQIEALRAKRAQAEEDRALEAKTWGASNRAALASALSQWKGDPEKTAALEALALGVDTTKQSDFAKNLLNAVMTKPKVLGAEAGVKKVEAGTDVAKAQAKAVPAKVEQGAGKLAEDIRKNKAAEAIRWAAMNRAAQNAATKLTTGQPETVQKEVRATTQKLGDSVAKEYGEISSALKEADRSLVAIKNQPPDVFAKVMQATNLDGLNTPEERALFRSVGELRRAAQKAQSGLAVTENERAEFLQLFGANWLQSPTSLIEAIEWMRRKTKDKLDQSFATYRAQGSVGNTAVQAYREAGGVTPDAQFLLPFNERQPKTATAPAPAPSAAVQSGGMVKVRHAATGKTATVDRAKADEMLKRTGFEEVK